MSDANELATRLAETIADLNGYIEKRALEWAEPRIEAAYRAARTEIDEVKRAAASDRQRSADLVTELRRQIAALERQIQPRAQITPMSAAAQEGSR